MQLMQLQRNDVEGALAYYVEKRDDGTLERKPWKVSILLKLQDDPSELLKRIAEADKAKTQPQNQ